MEIRNCPKCGSRWYSAAREGVWICDKCSAEIPPSKVTLNPKAIQTYDIERQIFKPHGNRLVV